MFRTKFEIEKSEDDGVDQLQSISTMYGKKMDRMQTLTNTVSGGQTTWE